VRSVARTISTEETSVGSSEPSNGAHQAGHSRTQSRGRPGVGILIVNADDWGRDSETTNRIVDCLVRHTISSVSAMVFMEDSERAGAIAREKGVDTGLHLNFTTTFSAPNCPPLLVQHQLKISKYLRRHRLAQIVFHPGLARSFEYVVTAQIDEYSRLYGKKPERIDGHHHMHLCANVQMGKLLPEGTLVRRNFSFESGEKSFVNRFYRKAVDRALAKRHPIADYLFNLPPLEPKDRLQKIFSLARNSMVELETHPINPDEYRFLMEGEFTRQLAGLPVAPRFVLRPFHEAA